MSTIFSNHCEEGYSDYAKYASVIPSTLLKSRWSYYKTLLDTITQKDNKSICIADFGTSDGGNIVPLFLSIIGFLKDVSFKGELTLIFNDLPGNNYNVLEKKIRTLERECMHVYLLMNACDMHKRCLPRDTLDIGLSTFALHMLSQVSIENGVGWNTASKSERQAMADDAANNWKLFLSHRCEEMIIGGYLIIRFIKPGQYPLAVEDAFIDIYKHDWITKEELRNINVPIYYRGKREILEPFEVKYFAPNIRLVDVHNFESPTATDYDVSVLPCKPWLKNILLSGLSSKRSDIDKECVFNNLFQRYEERCKDITSSFAKVIEVIIQKVK